MMSFRADMFLVPVEVGAMSIDTLRAFFDERVLGKLSESHPLQSAILRSVYFNDDGTEVLLESRIMTLLDGEVNSNCKSYSLPELGNLETIMTNALNNLTEFGGDPPFTIQDGIDMANDVIMISENNLQPELKKQESFATSAVPQTASVQKPTPKPSVRIIGTQTDMPPAIVEEIVQGVKKGSFQSGKDKFLQDGGKFAPKAAVGQMKSTATSNSKQTDSKNDNPLPTELEHCDKALVEKIEAEIVHSGQVVTFDEIAGLEFAKKCVNELICWPMTRPDLFQGLRSLPRGLLLFGPPGTGKTLIGKAIAHQAGATFFSISASSLTSKWIGEGEKTVRTLFAVAAYRQPSVVFIDEVDSLLCQRSSDENEASRRIKTEFLVQLDGAGTDLSARVVIVGATNRPEELDEAARRRFVKRIYIPLPDPASRKQLLMTLLKTSLHSLGREDLDILIARTDGFSGADVRSLCTEAAMGPVREIAMKQGDLRSVQATDVPPINRNHFRDAFDAVAPSVSPADLQRYIDWNGTFGSFRRMI